MSVELLTEHHLELLSLTGGCTGSSESTLVKMPHCWKSHVEAHIVLILQTCLLQVSVNGLEVLCLMVDRMGEEFKPHVTTSKFTFLRTPSLLVANFVVC